MGNESQFQKEQQALKIAKFQSKHPGQYTPLCPIDKGNISEISGCLQKLDKAHILDLEMNLGISHSKLTKMMDSPSFAEDVASAWFQREEQRGTPTWVNLVSALTDLLLKQEGISSEVIRTNNEASQNPKVSDTEHSLGRA